MAFTTMALCHQRRVLYMSVCVCVLLTEGLQVYISMHRQERKRAMNGKQKEQKEFRSRIERSKEVRRES